MGARTECSGQRDSRPTLPVAKPSSRDWLYVLILRGVSRMPHQKTPSERAFWLLGYLLAHAGFEPAAAEQLLKNLGGPSCTS